MSPAATPQVWCVTPSHSGGWGPVTELALLVARLWETTPRFIHPTSDYGLADKLTSMLPRLRGSRPPLLVIAAHPGDLLGLARPSALTGRFSAVGGWVIDSFWDERLPLFARRGHLLDALWITDAELVDDYARRTRLPVGWAPWGADALRLSRLPAGPRPIDVLRLGRQPRAWDDDDANEASLAGIGASYQGRFEGSTTDGMANQTAVQALLARSKLVLASGNRSSPADYTHPTREYITARFTESVAAGARIVGQPPATRATDLLPQEALIRVDVSRRELALPAIEAALADWSPELSRRLQQGALATLDWRHRIRDISATLGVTTPTLTRELAELDDARADR